MTELHCLRRPARREVGRPAPATCTAHMLPSCTWYVVCLTPRHTGEHSFFAPKTMGLRPTHRADHHGPPPLPRSPLPPRRPLVLLVLLKRPRRENFRDLSIFLAQLVRAFALHWEARKVDGSIPSEDIFWLLHLQREGTVLGNVLCSSQLSGRFFGWWEVALRADRALRWTERRPSGSVSPAVPDRLGPASAGGRPCTVRTVRQRRPQRLPSSQQAIFAGFGSDRLSTMTRGRVRLDASQPG